MRTIDTRQHWGTESRRRRLSRQERIDIAYGIVAWVLATGCACIPIALAWWQATGGAP
jgi:hypothetical protein